RAYSRSDRAPHGTDRRLSSIHVHQRAHDARRGRRRRPGGSGRDGSPRRARPPDRTARLRQPADQGPRRHGAATPARPRGGHRVLLGRHPGGGLAGLAVAERRLAPHLVASVPADPVLALVAYLVLPRLQTLVTSVYVPGYFIARTRTSDGLLGDPVNLAVDGTARQI